ncbi:MAG: hypothetical protein DRN27_06675 [Thermoplasmata archaeon]|nr:MAG: hypothetical protein DRN27_06675 [Thermoplasmata archaeon]
MVLKGECKYIGHQNENAEKFGHIGPFWFFPAKGALEFLMLKDFELTIDGELVDIESPVRLYFYRFTGFSPTPMGHDISINKNITVIGFCEEVRPLSQKERCDIHDEPLFDVYDIGRLGQTAYGISSADFNSDGLMDFAVSWATNPWPVSTPDISISIFYNNGDLPFTRNDIYTHKWEDWGYIWDVETEDFDNDGDIDFLFSLCESINQRKTNGTIYTLFNNGDNTFGEKTFVTRHSSDVSDLNGRVNPKLTSADFDGDGDIDFLVVDNSGIVEFYLNNGDGTFFSSGVIQDFGRFSKGLISGDYDGDGDIDFYVSAENNDICSLYLKLNQFVESEGSVIFSNESVEPCIQLFSKEWMVSLQSMDYNGDGNMDLIAGIRDTVVVFLKNNDSWQQYLAGQLPHYGGDDLVLVDGLKYGGLSAGDFDGDGREDLITGGMSGTPRLCLNNFLCIVTAIETIY